MTALATWLRTNSQKYLLRDSQARIASKYGIAPPDTHGSIFWTKVFVPIYRVLPWAVCSRAMALMPGSHRQRWSKSTSPKGAAI